MTIKRILALPMDPPSRSGVFETALHVASEFAAHIDIGFVRHVPLSYADTAGDEMSVQITAELLKDRNEDMEEIEAELRGLYDSFIADNKIVETDTPTQSVGPSAAWIAMEGHPADAIARSGGAYDLVITGQPEDSQSIGRIATESALFATGRPVVIAPPEPPAHIGETVLIAWNRGPQAARAFHAAKALLLERARRVRILSITTGAKQGPPASEVATNLRWHGIEADVVELSPDYRSVGEVLLAEASAIGADLLVMGAFSHSRLRQLILGGVTKYVFDNANLPVLMAH